MFTDMPKNQIVSSHAVLGHYKKKKRPVFSHISTNDETCICYFIVELKNWKNNWCSNILQIHQRHKNLNKPRINDHDYCFLWPKSILLVNLIKPTTTVEVYYKILSKLKRLCVIQNWLHEILMLRFVFNRDKMYHTRSAFTIQ